MILRFLRKTLLLERKAGLQHIQYTSYFLFIFHAELHYCLITNVRPFCNKKKIMAHFSLEKNSGKKIARAQKRFKITYYTYFLSFF